MQVLDTSVPLSGEEHYVVGVHRTIFTGYILTVKVWTNQKGRFGFAKAFGPVFMGSVTPHRFKPFHFASARQRERERGTEGKS